MNDYFLAVTGASGAVYAITIAEELQNLGNSVSLCATEQAKYVFEFETGTPVETFAKERDIPLFDNADYFKRPASGSGAPTGMIIAPCSMSALGRIAGGLCCGLIDRAAAVCLKERRPLILVTRETPLSVINLRNMLEAATAGAVILPACPGFYMKPESVNELVSFVAGAAISLLGLSTNLRKPWCGLC